MSNFTTANGAMANGPEESEQVPMTLNPIVYFYNKIGHTNPTFYRSFGYEIELYLDNQLIPQSRITGDFTYQKSSGQVTTLAFTLLNNHGVQDHEYFMGKNVVVKITTANGTFNMFTGYVDTPSVNIITEMTTYTCTDRRNKRILNLTARSATFPSMASVGRYSNSVFGKPKDKLDILTKRLQTVPASFDFDNNGLPQITRWLPKTTADFVLDGSQVYYTQPQVTYANYSARLNTVNINLAHTFQRLHYQLASATYTMGLADPFAWYAAGQPSFPARSTIDSAARGGSWEVVYGPVYAPVWPAGGYTKATATGSDVLTWQPDKVTNFSRAKMRSVGFIINDVDGVPLTQATNILQPVLDANGFQVMEIYRTEIEDTTSTLCIGGSWKAVKRFSQNVTHNFELKLTVPSTLSKFDEVMEEDTVTVESDFNTDNWEKTPLGLTFIDENTYSDQKTNLEEVDNALRASLSKAKTSLLSAHRDVKVSFRRSLWPEIDVTHTVEINSTPLKCRAKVESITHNINILTGEAVTSVDLLLSRSSGTDTDSVLSISPDIVDTDVYIGEPKQLYFGTIFDEVPNALGFQTNTGVGAQRTGHPEIFTVGYPEISKTLTDNRELTAAHSYSVNIPNDYLVITSNVYS